MDYTSQNTEIGSVEIQTLDGSKIYYRNGGVDGHFEISLKKTLPLDSQEWEFEGSIDGKFVIKGIDLSQIELDGHYAIYGNTETGDVAIMNFADFQNQMK